jgi:hypothetical protein
MGTGHNRGMLLLVTALLVSFGMNSSQAVTATSLSEKNINQVVPVKIGTQIPLTLHSMYWRLAPPARYGALSAKGAPVLKPILPGPTAPKGCSIPGSGCGTQTWKFVATKVGISHLIATRTTCGEAMRCTGSNGRFEVTVKVSR